MSKDNVISISGKRNSQREHISNITPELKEAIKRQDKTALIQLGNLVKEALLYKKCHSKIYSFPLDEATQDVTTNLFNDIYKGKFDDKDISLNIVCMNYLYDFLAQKYNVKKDTFHRMKRIQDMSKKYNIAITFENAYKFVGLSAYDGYSVSIGMTEVYNCIDVIINWMRRTPYDDGRIRAKNFCNDAESFDERIDRKHYS